MKSEISLSFFSIHVNIPHFTVHSIFCPHRIEWTAHANKSSSMQKLLSINQVKPQQHFGEMSQEDGRGESWRLEKRTQSFPEIVGSLTR